MATRKLTSLDAAEQIEDMAVPPGNRLEPLRGKGADGTRFGSTTNGGLSSNGLPMALLG